MADAATYRIHLAGVTDVMVDPTATNLPLDDTDEDRMLMAAAVGYNAMSVMVHVTDLSTGERAEFSVQDCMDWWA